MVSDILWKVKMMLGIPALDRKQFGGFVCAMALVGSFAFTPAANAFMRTLDRSEIAHLEPVQDTNFVELYEHPDLDAFEFTKIYIEPVSNQMRRADIYGIGLRPFHFDDLVEDYHSRLLAALADSGLLTNEPNEQTLVISVAITDVQRFQQQTTGSHLANAAPSHLLRGGAIMEMTWRAGPGGEIVLALRDGRTRALGDPVTDRDDRFTDARDAFDDWAADLASFFNHETLNATH